MAGDGLRPAFEAFRLSVVLTGEEFLSEWRGDVFRDPEFSRLKYEDYLRTAHWASTRRRALQRAGYQCQRCEASRVRLDVHHLTYIRLGREAERDLTVLCADCHRAEHGKQEPA